jgi:ABC-type multidrug transport system fused ATPase/permease subunit
MMMSVIVTVNISMGLRWASTVIGGIAYLFVISWKLTLVMLSVIPLVAFSARSYGQKVCYCYCYFAIAVLDVLWYDRSRSYQVRPKMH